MLYGIRVHLMFDKKNDADEVWTALKQYAKKRSLKSLTGEKSFILYEECHHDESPPQPCVIIERFEKE